jgi:hypothetical protein
MLDEMITLWEIEVKFLFELHCHLLQEITRYSGEEWDMYSVQLDKCPNEEWAVFARIVSLMRNRIHHSITMLIDSQNFSQCISYVYLKLSSCPILSSRAFCIK